MGRVLILEEFERTCERMLGKSIEEIGNMPLSDLHDRIRAENNGEIPYERGYIPVVMFFL